MKKNSYWKSVAVLLGYNVGELVKLCAPYSADDEAAGMLSEMANAMASLLKKDGEYNIVQKETYNQTHAEAVQNLKAASSEALVASAIKKDAPSVDAMEILTDDRLNGNEKQILLYLKLHPHIKGYRKNSLYREVSDKLGITYRTAGLKVRKLLEMGYLL